MLLRRASGCFWDLVRISTDLYPQQMRFALALGEIDTAINPEQAIGMLERLLVYGFVLQGQYAAIGLILAAKSFARFKEMDERDFAEYVLIGTLLSVTSAVAVGELIELLLP